jgi:hypothetical protein
LAKRKTNSPWGSAYKEGLPSTAVNDRVEVDEILYPSVNTGAIDVASGQWQGVTLSDKNFTIDATHESVANGASVLSPQATPDYIDMTNFTGIFIAIRPSNAGNYEVTAVMGPDSNTFANLSPVNPTSTLRGFRVGTNTANFDNALNDGAESLTANVWNIFSIMSSLRDQKLLQWKIVNNTGGVSNITFAYLRVV